MFQPRNPNFMMPGVPGTAKACGLVHCFMVLGFQHLEQEPSFDWCLWLQFCLIAVI